MLFYRRRVRVIENLIDREKVSPADYTIMASNFARTDTLEDIKQFFTAKSLPNCTLEIKKVVLCYNLGNYMGMQTKKMNLELKKAKLQGKNESEKIKQLEQEIDDLAKQIDAFEKECETNLADKFTGTAFVVYQNSQGQL